MLLALVLKGNLLSKCGMINQKQLLIDPSTATMVIFLYLLSMASLLKSTFTIMLLRLKRSFIVRRGGGGLTRAHPCCRFTSC
ncbi:hypothetical protein GDO81_017247 [Engystomops pustulosus]|uniref:Uncharacterized protein n=1 Tax=Engystomops pustulosus TaxID=76066 RepID=A0AAV7AD36_ENGPU|nr:hypothetical protein GDO81_017247 [Engystomops pustulosus]